MFSSWRVEPTAGPGSDGVALHHVQTLGTTGGRETSPQACNVCRAKKLKCSGERSGCDRCKDLGSRCQYAVPGRGGGRNGQSPGARVQNIMSGHVDGDNTMPLQSRSRRRPNFPRDNHWHLFTHAGQLPDLHGSEQMNKASQELADELLRDFFVAGTDMDIINQPSSPLPPKQQPAHPGVPPACSTSVDMHMGPNTPSSKQVDLDNWIVSTMQGSLHVDYASAAGLLPSPVTTDFQPGSGSMPQIKSTGGTSAAVAPDERCIADSLNDKAEPQCNCLARIVLLLDEFESFGHGKQMLDSILAALKEALGSVLAVVSCSSCTMRVEIMTLLTFLIARLVDVFQLLPAMLPPGGADLRVPPREAFIGDYQINSSLEWDMILRMMALLLTQRLGSLARSVRDAADSADQKSLIRRLTTAQGRLDSVHALLQNRHRASDTTWEQSTLWSIIPPRPTP